MKKFADRICLARKENNFNQQDIADILGVTRATISSWETGRTEPNRHHIVELSRIYNVTIDYLLGINNNTKKINYKEKLEIGMIVKFTNGECAIVCQNQILLNINESLSLTDYDDNLRYTFQQNKLNRVDKDIIAIYTNTSASIERALTYFDKRNDLFFNVYL